MTEIGQQTVGDVDHGGGSGARRRRRRRRSGRGTRWASTTARGERKPRPSTTSPAAAQPSRPVHGDPVARPGAGAQHRVASVELAEHGDRDGDVAGPGHVPADQADAGGGALLPSARRRIPAPRPPPGSSGAENPTSTLVARAPTASMSATLTAIALRPTSPACDQSRRKCTPSTRTSSELTRSPSRDSTAASSPGPTRTSAPGARSAVIAAIRQPDADDHHQVDVVVHAQPAVSTRDMRSRACGRHRRRRPGFQPPLTKGGHPRCWVTSAASIATFTQRGQRRPMMADLPAKFEQAWQNRRACRKARQHDPAQAVRTLQAGVERRRRGPAARLRRHGRAGQVGRLERLAASPGDEAMQEYVELVESLK